MSPPIRRRLRATLQLHVSMFTILAELTRAYLLAWRQIWKRR